MQPSERYKQLDLEFWANIKLLNQRLGYAERKSKANPNPGFVIPTKDQMIEVFQSENLNVSKLVVDNSLTDFGNLIIEYMTFRGDLLVNHVMPNLMNKDQARDLFNQKKNRIEPDLSFTHE